MRVRLSKQCVVTRFCEQIIDHVSVKGPGVAQTFTIAVGSLKDDADANAVAFSQGQRLNLAAVDTHLGAHRAADAHLYGFAILSAFENRTSQINGFGHGLISRQTW